MLRTGSAKHNNTGTVITRSLSLLLENIVLTFWVIAVTGLFAARVHNPFSVVGLSELAILLSFPYALFAQIKRRKGQLDFILLMTPFIFSLYSAIRAHFSYDQSLFLGFMEERRMFIVWYYFPLVFHARNFKRLTQYLVGVGFLIVILGFFYRFGLIDGFKRIEISATDGRFGRANFAGKTVIIIALLSLGQIYVKDTYAKAISKRRAIVFFVSALAFIVVVTQTRQLMLNVGLMTSLFFLLGQGRAVSNFWALFALTITVILFTLGQDGVAGKLQNIADFGEYLDHDTLIQSARFRTIMSIFQSATLWGNGSLSGQFLYGFDYEFGENFFLSDVGIFGTFFRYGIVGVLCITVTLYFMGHILASTRGVQSAAHLSMRLCVLALLPFWMGAGLLEYSAQVIALVLAISQKLNESYPAAQIQATKDERPKKCNSTLS